PWPINEREVAAVTNEPGWLMADYTLYRLENLNGFLIKPFRQREEVKIPKASVKAYFRNFILKVVNKVEVSAEGFSVEQFNELQGCELEPVQHLFDDRWVLQVQMRYQNARFGWQEKRQLRTTLEMDEAEDEVRILQVRRDPAAEKGYLERLGEFDLILPEGQSHYQLSQPDDRPFALIEWLTRQRAGLEAAGFTLVPPNVQGQDVSLDYPHINMEVATGNDWFDLKGMVEVGEHRFPFLSLAKYIREGNRFYPLPDGTTFLIPEEWMTRYRHLASFGKKEGEHLRITKSQYTLLDALDIPQPQELNPEDIPTYQPSPLLKAQLRPYQLEGVRWLTQLYHRDLGACLADDMGLGKTLQTIALLLFAKEEKARQRANARQGDAPIQNGKGQLGLFAPADDEDFLQPLNTLIVLPASLLYNWESEIKQFAPSLSIYQHFGPKRHRQARLLARFDTILTTYQTALRDVELLQELQFEYIVLDESQQIKNRDSKVFKAINKLQAKHKLSLSGTPIENSLSDLWSQMQFINPNLLGSYRFFRQEFINPIEKAQDDAKKDRLRQLVKPYLLRRTKEEVAKDLPPLTTRTFFTEMTKEQRKLYEKEKSAARNYLLDNFSANDSKYRILVVQTLTRLRQLVNHPVLLQHDYEKDSGKFQDVLEQWDIIRRGGHKVLMFSSFVQYLELFRKELEQQDVPYAWLTGNLSAQQRKAEIQKFQEDPSVQAFFISIKTGGTGLNLTAADYVFILDPWWNPTTEQQAIARAHRIGQDKNVIAIKF
ncbi:MAG: DEAD/DEAH box helicase family protein, partial [Lewinella sp.]|nr:DEAD/DEAH box helicase family protein [Lewinella sp.]